MVNIVDMTDEEFHAYVSSTESLLDECDNLLFGIDLNYLSYIANRIELL